MDGDIKPKKAFWKKWWFWVLVILLVIIFNYFRSLGQSTNSNAPAPVQQKTEEVKSNYVYNIPSLLGKNVDEVSQELQPYKQKSLEPTDQQIKAGVKTWEVSFEKDGKDLLVTYDIATKKVIDYFLGSDDPVGATKDKNHLLELGNLKENDSRYRIEFVKVLKDPSFFTGIKVTPQ